MGLEDNNLGADLISGLRGRPKRPPRCQALRRGLGRGFYVAPLPSDYVQPLARVIFVKGHHLERFVRFC